jgi:hypothetical protein
MPAQNQTLGRGRVYFAPFVAGTETPTGRRYLGNTPEFNISVETETLDHYNSDEGVREVDLSVPVQTDRTATLMTDNVSKENLALFFLGSTSALSQASGSNIASDYDNAQQGLTYQLGKSATNPTGDRNVTTVVVRNDAGSPVTYVLNTDYTLDAARGQITVVEGGGIANGTNLRITHSRPVATRDRIISGNSAIYGELYYQARNPAGQQIDYVFPKVRISPSGDFALKAESDFQSFSFSVTILKKEGLQAMYADGQAV